MIGENNFRDFTEGNFVLKIPEDKKPLADSILAATHDPRNNIWRINNYIDICSGKSPQINVSDNLIELDSKINKNYTKPLFNILKSIAEPDNFNLLDIVNNNIQNNETLINLINDGRKINNINPLKPEECKDSLKVIFNEIQFYSDNIYNIASNYRHKYTFQDETTQKLVSVNDHAMESFKELIYVFKNDIDDIPYYMDINKIEAKKEKIQLLHLVKKTKNLLRKSHFNKNHPIEIFTSDESRDYFINADPKLLSKAIENVLGNAIKYLPKDDLDSPISIILDKDKIIISDKGIGINKKDLPKINEFKTGNRTADAINHEKGTGTGLFVANKCLEKNAFKMILESKSISEYPTDHGTQVTIFLSPDQPHSL